MGNVCWVWVEWLGVKIHGDGGSSGGVARAAAGDEEGDQRSAVRSGGAARELMPPSDRLAHH